MYIIGENFVQCSFGASTSFMFSSIYSHTLIVFYTLSLLIFLLIYLQIIYILTQTYICIYIQIHMNMPIEFPLTFQWDTKYLNFKNKPPYQKIVNDTLIQNLCEIYKNQALFLQGGFLCRQCNCKIVRIIMTC